MASAQPATRAPKFSIPTTGGEFRLGDQGRDKLVDAGGRVRREWRKVRVKGHAAEVLEAARES